MTSETFLPLVAQAQDWLVINKPTGVSVHNEANDVLSLLKKQLPPETSRNLHLVHRLDKETSGLLLVATKASAAGTLAEQFQNHRTEKTYFALLRGALPVSDSWLEWGLPLTDKAEGRRNPQGLAKDRVEAKTRYRVVKANAYFSLVEVRLLTGRQHQIRKHAALAKHAIVGDARYGDPKYNAMIAQRYGKPRLFLHAFSLKLNIDGEERLFEAPLPEEFLQMF